MALTRVKVENPTGNKYLLRVTNAETGEVISATRIEIIFDPNIDQYVARIDIPSPIIDLVAPVEVNAS